MEWEHLEGRTLLRRATAGKTLFRQAAAGKLSIQEEEQKPRPS